MTSPDLPRVALISYHTSPLAPLGGPQTGGMNVYVRESAAALAARGHLVDVFTRDDGSMPPVESPGVGVRVIALPAGPRAPLGKDALAEHLPGFLNELRAVRQREGVRYDLVHSHYWMSGWAGRHLQRLWDVPHIAMFHTLGEVKRRARIEEQEPEQRIEAERQIVATADRIVTASTHERGLLARLYGADESRVAVIPCGVDLDRFRPLDRAAARAAVGLPLDAQVVLFIGRPEPLKGADLLIDAVAELEDSRPLLVLVGGDERSSAYLGSLRARADAAGITDRVRFAGATPQERLPLYYNAADVCVVPSYYESFGLVALEAMACGTPVIASEVGGLAFLVKDGETGFHVPDRDPEVLADRICQIITDPLLRAELGEQAGAYARGYAWPIIAEKIVGVYEALLRRPIGEVIGNW
jgi:D-inositol-3-phosphate glycosyltransferase